MSGAKFHVNLIINGSIQATPAKLSETLSTVAWRGLKLSGNTNRNRNDWQIRDANGVLLENQRKMKDFKFAPGARLFASLQVGAGG